MYDFSILMAKLVKLVFLYLGAYLLAAQRQELDFLPTSLSCQLHQSSL